MSIEANAQESEETTILHVDSLSQVQVKIPWPHAMVKGPKQLRRLIQEKKQRPAPEHIEYTSAVYAPQGTPYFVIWKTLDAKPWRKIDLLDTSFLEKVWGLEKMILHRETLTGSADLHLSDGKAKVLFQIGKDRTVFLGYFYRQSSDLQGFETIKESFSLDEPLRESWSQLKLGISLLSILSFFLFLIIFVLLVMLLRAVRRKPSLISPKKHSLGSFEVRF